MTIQYEINGRLGAEELGALFQASGIRRPNSDQDRLRRMIDNANLDCHSTRAGRLVGVARALTDYSWWCYLSDLAVDCAYQRQGIGRELVRLVRAEAEGGTALVLVSAPEASEYYPRIGFEPIESGWIIKRSG
jgi:ribosomal protein S18 acetylase RimI-like enzyme